MRWDYQALDRVRREAKQMRLRITVDMSYAQIKSLIEQHRMEHSNGTSEYSSTTGTRQASLQLADESTAVAESSSRISTSHNEAQDLPSQSSILDDSEDRLLQIIGDSFKATMSRNHSAFDEPQSARRSSDGLIGKSREYAAMGKGGRRSSGARPRRGPSNPAFEDNLSRIVHG